VHCFRSLYTFQLKSIQVASVLVPFCNMSESGEAVKKNYSFPSFQEIEIELRDKLIPRIFFEVQIQVVPIKVLDT